MLGRFYIPGKASFIVGGQWGSEGKGAAAAFAARHLAEYGKYFQVVTTNAGVQSGHTSIHEGKKRVFFHLPTYPAISAQYGYKPIVYLNAGSVIDPEVLFEELKEYHEFCQDLIIHPNAAVITAECKEMEGREDSSTTRIASTRKGVGAAIALKVMRCGLTAKEHPSLKVFTHKWHRNFLDDQMRLRAAVLAEIPQGYGLGLDAGFYPYCTSRNCTPAQAMADAELHPSTYGHTMMVVRTFPIRVGNIWQDKEMKEMAGWSGGCYADQRETSWDQIGQAAEITTVTKRVRRVFTWSNDQIRDAMAVIKPDVVYITFVDYLKKDRAKLEEIVWCIRRAANDLDIIKPEIIIQDGPSTDDVQEWRIGA